MPTCLSVERVGHPNNSCHHATIPPHHLSTIPLHYHITIHTIPPYHHTTITPFHPTTLHDLTTIWQHGAETSNTNSPASNYFDIADLQTVNPAKSTPPSLVAFILPQSHIDCGTVTAARLKTAVSGPRHPKMSNIHSPEPRSLHIAAISSRLRHSDCCQTQNSCPRATAP